MKTKILSLALFFAGILCFSSCSLDEDNPSGGDAVITNYETWAGLQVYCYSPLSEDLFSAFDFLCVSECGTDMWMNPAGKDYAPELFYYDGLTISTNATNKAFMQLYATVASCNAVINHADEVEGGTEDAIATFVAEAKVLRAFYNLQLVTYYGPVTLTQNEPDAAETTPTRNTVEEFYTSITTDLQEAAEVLGTEPYGGNYGRVCKKTALGLLARAYAQGAGEGLSENGVSYWQRAKEVAVDMINNLSGYGAYLYDDVDDLWAQDNNRDNAEALFTAVGRDANSEAYNYVNCNNNIFRKTQCNPNSCADLYKTAGSSNFYLGNMSECCFAPSKYAIDVFDATWDKRYENTFMTAFAKYSEITSGSMPFSGARFNITSSLASKYGCASGIVYPYVDLVKAESLYGVTQYSANGVWPNGTTSGTASLLEETKNAYVIPYPVADDDTRFLIVLSKDYKSAEERATRRYFTVNIDDLFGSDGMYVEESYDGTSGYTLFPSLIKYNWLYDGVGGSSTYYKNGDIMIMRTAELYLIAAEACQQLGDAGTAATYLQVLRDRAAREGTTAPTLSSVTEETILDEYARELAGEYQRWALLKRHHVLGERLAKYNTEAYSHFNEDIHYCRPISYQFLEQIDNPDEYGDNGYGTTASKGF